MFWCDYCKVWMQDNPHAKAVHERGIKHQERVEKSELCLQYPQVHEVPKLIGSGLTLNVMMGAELRDMRRKAASDEKEKDLAVSTMSSIEAKALQSFQEDLKRAGEAQRDHVGTWVNFSVLHYLSYQSGIYSHAHLLSANGCESDIHIVAFRRNAHLYSTDLWIWMSVHAASACTFGVNHVHY